MICKANQKIADHILSKENEEWYLKTLAKAKKNNRTVEEQAMREALWTVEHS